MKITRRQILVGGASTAILATTSPSLFAQGIDWPKRPIKAVVPASAGGDTDFNARMIAKYFEQITKVPMIVSNVTGGGGTIGVAQVEDADADGNTLFFGHTGQLIVTELSGLSDHKFDAKLSVSCIPAVDKSSVLISGPAERNKTLESLISYAKAHPGEVIYGTEFGGLTNLQGLLFAKAADIQLKFVDVGSASDKIAALLGQRIDLASIAYGPTKDYVSSKKLVALAQYNNPANPLLPEAIKPFKAQGLDLAMNNPYVMAFPKATNPAIVHKMSDIVEQITKIKAYEDSLAKAYSEPITFFPTNKAVAELNSIRESYLPFESLMRNAKK